MNRTRDVMFIYFFAYSTSLSTNAANTSRVRSRKGDERKILPRAKAIKTLRGIVNNFIFRLKWNL